MNYQVKEEGDFKYIESDTQGENLLLLHGLFGALSNFQSIIDKFSDRYNIIVPILPIFELPIREVSLSGLVEYVAKLVEYKNFDKIHLLGNSLGGHIALLYVLSYSEKVSSVILTGSSGLFESAMGSSFPKRGNYEFIQKKTEDVFYNKAVATKELIDEVYNIVNDRNKAIRIIATAKSAVRHNLSDKLHHIKTPTLLVWGREDSVTPAFVGEKFNELIEGSKLIFIDECGHAPMMEKPVLFNQELESFLDEMTKKNLEGSS